MKLFLVFLYLLAGTVVTCLFATLIERTGDPWSAYPPHIQVVTTVTMVLLWPVALALLGHVGLRGDFGPIDWPLVQGWCLDPRYLVIGYAAVAAVMFVLLSRSEARNRPPDPSGETFVGLVGGAFWPVVLLGLLLTKLNSLVTCGVPRRR